MAKEVQVEGNTMGPIMREMGQGCGIEGGEKGGRVGCKQGREEMVGEASFQVQ